MFPQWNSSNLSGLVSKMLATASHMKAQWRFSACTMRTTMLLGSLGHFLKQYQIYTWSRHTRYSESRLVTISLQWPVRGKSGATLHGHCSEISLCTEQCKCERVCPHLSCLEIWLKWTDLFGIIDIFLCSWAHCSNLTLPHSPSRNGA